MTNPTPGQSFTPTLAATHTDGVSLFTVGHEASLELAALAEGGEVAPLMDALDANPRVAATIASEGLLAPGSKVSLRIKAGHRADRVSVASMLIPTNDAFFALNGVPLPHGRGTVVRRSPAYEPNEERCAAIPGPVCGGEGTSAAAGHIHAGIHATGDLLAADRDWPTRWLRSAYAAFDNKHLALSSLQPCGCAKSLLSPAAATQCVIGARSSSMVPFTRTSKPDARTSAALPFQ